MRIQNIRITYLVFSMLLIGSFAFYSIAEENSQSNQSVFDDFDQDGLSNDEEKVYGTDSKIADTDGDGYSDGAEVRTGYDPLKPAPGDKLIADHVEDQKSASDTAIADMDKNITAEIAADISSVIKEGLSGKQDFSIDELNMIVSEAIQEKTQETVKTDEQIKSEIQVKEQDYEKLPEEQRVEKEKADTLEYLTGASYILANNFPTAISSTSDVTNAGDDLVKQVGVFANGFGNMAYFDTLENNADNILQQMEEVSVPENMLDIHAKGVKIAEQAIRIKSRITQNSNTDPVAQIVNLSQMSELIGMATELSGEVSAALGGLGINEIPIDL